MSKEKICKSGCGCKYESNEHFHEGACDFQEIEKSWEDSFKEIYNNRMRMNNDCLFRNEVPWIMDFIRENVNHANRQGAAEEAFNCESHQKDQWNAAIISAVNAIPPYEGFYKIILEKYRGEVRSAINNLFRK